MDAVTPRPEATEIEYKFLMPEPAAKNAVLDLLRDKGYRTSPQRVVHQQDLYLDTFDWRLLRSGLALRLRRAGGAAIYGIKSLGKVEEGRAERREVEVRIEGNAADPTAVADKRIHAEIDPIIHPRRLLVQLAVRTERIPYRLRCPEGAQVELVFDTTSFSARGMNRPRRSKPLYEMEAELKKGPPADLEALGRLLAGCPGLLPSRQSKLETAIERLGIVFPSKNPPPPLRVKLEDRLDVAVQKILSFQFHRIEENLPGVLADLDTEFVHQARVSTRRMRSALRLFRKAIPEKAAADLAADLSWLGALFGGVRDLDVFLLNLPGATATVARAPERAVAILTRHIQERRAVLLSDLLNGLASPRYRRFRTRVAAFTGRPPAKKPAAPLALTAVHTFASERIPELFQAVLAQGRKVLAKPKLRNFHRLRIEFKRLRYACEFVGPAYGDGLKPFIGETVQIQDCLGELQDTVFTRSLIDGLLEEWKGNVIDPRLLFLFGELYELQGELARARQAAFREIWSRFDQETTAAGLAAALKRA
ncbi:MAG TPA: CHAD domain-containing protein [Syntrophales bacterium]|nr:CHAD domain-containing protein [Syntrophales bacterium]